jgi:hypothetical protein
VQRRLSVRVAAAILAAAWLLAYGGTVTGGFIKDDFAWILHSRIDGWSSVSDAFLHAEGFYRPIVQLSFGVTEALFGNNPIPYALTNVTLAFGCAAAIFALIVSLGLPSWAALLGTATWAFNFHGINMAVAWLSGRTSLFGTLLSTLSVLALTRRHSLAAGVLCFGALLSKEEVLALPVIVSLWAIVDRSLLKRTIPMWAALALYLVLRNQSGAWGISSAPAYYQFVTDPMVILRNILEYADRSMTFGVIVILAALAGLGRMPGMADDLRRQSLKGLAWLVCGFALTIWLPVRSSLYVVFPSVGVAIIAAAIVSATARQAVPARAMRIATAGLLIPFLLLPLYWRRNERWTDLRALSNETFRAIDAEPLAANTLVVLEDDMSTRTNFQNAFGTLFREAGAVYFGDRLLLWLDPLPPESAGDVRPQTAAAATFRLVDGRVERALNFQAVARSRAAAASGDGGWPPRVAAIHIESTPQPTAAITEVVANR